MLPAFGSIVFVSYSDGSTALRGWADSDTLLAPLVLQLELELMGEGATIHIGPAVDYLLARSGREWVLIPATPPPAAFRAVNLVR